MASKPETGMGYHGRRIEDVAIVEGMIGEVRGHTDIPFEPDDNHCG